MKKYETVSDRVRLKKGLTGQGQQILAILQGEYQMTRENAMRLIKDGGALLATAILMRNK